MNDVLRIKRVAEKLVEKYGTSDPFQICAALDIEVRYSHLGSLSGYYCVMHRIPYIVLNSTLNSVSSRIICAHELGHDRLHRRLARGGILTDFDIFLIDCKTEREANIFAAHLLISDASLALYRRNYGNMDISGASAFFGVTPELVSIKLGRI